MLERKKQEWAAWVEKEFTHCKTVRTAFERQWYVNLAFVNGRHYVNPIDAPGLGFRLTTPKAPRHRVRMVVNKVRMAVRTETAKMASSKPIPFVVPATNEDEDFAAAKVGERILKARFMDEKFQKQYRKFIWWGSVTGTSYIKQFWDMTIVDPEAQIPPQQLTNPATGEPIFDDTGAPVMMPSPVVRGDVHTEAVTPFHIYVPDMLHEDIEDQPYVLHVMTRTQQWVRNTYGFDANPDSASTSSILESAVLGSKASGTNNDSVLVKEIWIKPKAHPDFPEGGAMVVVNNRVVQLATKWPLPYKEFPFYKYDGIPTGGYFGDSIVTDLIPLNKEYNRKKSQSLEITNTLGFPKLVAAKGSIDVRRMSNNPTEPIFYQAGFPAPVVVPGAEVPVSMQTELDRLTADMDDLSGQHEITRGNTPSQVTSGTAIAFLQEQDDTKLHYQVASIEGCVERMGKHHLKLLHANASDERLIKIAGNDMAYEAKRFKASDLRGNCDVRIQTGSALPQSKAAKQALVTEFMQYGWIDPTVGLELMDMGGLDKILNELLIDKKQAQRENMKLSEINPAIIADMLAPPVEGAIGPDGQPAPHQPQPPMPVNSWDNHEVHIQVHNQYRKTQEFEMLPPELKQAFELHVQLHQLALSQNLIGAGGNVVVENKPEPPMPPGMGGPPQEEGNGEPSEDVPEEASNDSGPPVPNAE